MSMIVELRDGDVLQIGDATVRLKHKSGQRALLIIDAPRSLTITPPNRIARMSTPQTQQEQSHVEHLV